MTYIWIDEAGDLKPEHLRAAMRFERTARRAAEKRERLRRAKGWGWFNWYANRGRLSLNATREELRALSWRKVL